MSIKKVSATTLRKQGHFYTTFSNDVFDLIQSGEAIAIWCYLLRQSDGWIVRKADIQKRLGFGKDRYAKAMKHLRELGLITDDYIREGKKIIGKELVCHAIPCLQPAPTLLDAGKRTCNEKVKVTKPLNEQKPAHIIKDQLLNKGINTHIERPAMPAPTIEEIAFSLVLIANTNPSAKVKREQCSHEAGRFLTYYAERDWAGCETKEKLRSKLESWSPEVGSKASTKLSGVKSTRDITLEEQLSDTSWAD